MPRRTRRRRSRKPRPRSGGRGKRSGRKDKSIYQRFHTRGAARNRYGLRLSTEDLKTMVDIIMDKDPCTCLKVFNQSNRVSRYVIKWKSAWLPVVYDRHRKNIVTFLPRAALRDYLERVKGRMEYYEEEPPQNGENS